MKKLLAFVFGALVLVTLPLATQTRDFLSADEIDQVKED